MPTINKNSDINHYRISRNNDRSSEAEEAGLQVNDLIVGTNGELIIGEIGTIVSLTVKIKENLVKFKIIRDKIYY